jgi:hypothetical protein
MIDYIQKTKTMIDAACGRIAVCSGCISFITVLGFLGWVLGVQFGGFIFISPSGLRFSHAFRSFLPYSEQLSYLCETSSSHGGEYDVQSDLLIPDDGGSTHL